MKYQNYRTELYILNAKHEWKEQEIEIKKYIRILENDKKNDTRNDLVWCYYWLSRSLYKQDPIKNYKCIKKYLKKAVSYNAFQNEDLKAKSRWLLAMLYRKINPDGYREKIIKLYKKSANYYKNINCEEAKKLYADLLNNIAYITSDISCISESIKIYQELIKSNFISKAEIEDIYETAYYSYINNNLISYANYYYEKIKDKDILNNIYEFNSRNIIA